MPAGSPYYNIQTSYYDGSGNYMSNAIKLAGSTSVGYPHGTTPSVADVWSVVSDAITAGTFPVDESGVFFVLTSADVKQTPGFCSQYCGWHAFNYYGDATIKYGFVGDASTACPFSCISQTGVSPNGNVAADGMVSILAHEVMEAGTDPTEDAWYGSSVSDESGDQCVWSYGTTFRTANGAMANVRLAGRSYLVQQQLVNGNAPYCALSYVSPPTASASRSWSHTASASRSLTATATATRSWTPSLSPSATLSPSTPIRPDNDIFVRCGATVG